jgi:hypothetical protein
VSSVRVCITHQVSARVQYCLLLSLYNPSVRATAVPSCVIVPPSPCAAPVRERLSCAVRSLPSPGVRVHTRCVRSAGGVLSGQHLLRCCPPGVSSSVSTQATVPPVCAPCVRLCVLLRVRPEEPPGKRPGLFVSIVCSRLRLLHHLCKAPASVRCRCPLVPLKTSVGGQGPYLRWYL